MMNTALATTSASHAHTSSVGDDVGLTQLDLHDPLDIIGTGSFGIIRKVRRKADGMILARKELNFDRMNDRDRKQIVAEVNILKDLNHEHIVRYHDRYVDRENGILYILMEYCGGGDLGSVIKHAHRSNRPIAEDLVWKYFLQLVLALCHCHHPGLAQGVGSGREERRSSLGGERRGVVLHRDLKPENVFLDENGNVKLGDFGLSKALVDASFANTYVGTPYYMSPEVMHSKTYDAKSDIWSLGCLIYELCALKPPFHDARSLTELALFVKNGRIPPLPRGYSPALQAVIKSMLNLNPAMRPSAQQLLQNERLELMYKVVETERLLITAKAHKQALLTRERDLIQREAALSSAHEQFALVEAEMNELRSTNSTLVNQLAMSESHAMELRTQVAMGQQEVVHLTSLVSQFESEKEHAVREAVMRREAELDEVFLRREEEVVRAMERREEEITESIRRREEELADAWSAREEEVKAEVEEREERVREVLAMVDEARRAMDSMNRCDGERPKGPNTEIHSLLASLSTLLSSSSSTAVSLSSSTSSFSTSQLKASTIETPTQQTRRSTSRPLPPPSPLLNDATPSTAARPLPNPYYSAMKGVVLTATGEVLATPSPAEVARMVLGLSPEVRLNVPRIFDGVDDEDDREGDGAADDGVPREVGCAVPDLELSELGSEGESGEEFVIPSVPVGNDESESEDDHTSTGIRPPIEESPCDRRRSISSSLAVTIKPSANPRSRSSQSRSVVGDRNPMRSRVSTSTTKRPGDGNDEASSSAPQKKTEMMSDNSAPPTRLRRPSMRNLRPVLTQTSTNATGALSTGGTSTTAGQTTKVPFQPTRTTTATAPLYNLEDEENLPSPFLRRAERDRLVKAKLSTSTNTTSASNPSNATSATVARARAKRPNAGNALRTLAAANAAEKQRHHLDEGAKENTNPSLTTLERPSIANARKASEEARKVLLS